MAAAGPEETPEARPEETPGLPFFNDILLLSTSHLIAELVLRLIIETS